MNKAVILLLGLVIINFCSAECSENQIDINSGSLSELQKITGIGPVYAQRIIDNRPFDSLDELTNVNGIAEKRLEDIKNQGLVCVSLENNYNEKDSIKNYTKENSDNDKEKNEMQYYEKEFDTESEIKELRKEIEMLKQELENKADNEKIEENNSNTSFETIKLSPKNIKSDENKEKLEKSDYAICGFVAFSFMIVLLVFIRRNKIREELV